MRKTLFFLMSIVFITGLSNNLYAQYALREDVIWARTTSENINLDGILNEASWAQAESLMIIYGESAGLPTSGWALEGGTVTDPTNATVKFLAKDNQLYVAFIIPDSSVGGQVWNSTSGWDGLLMNVKNAGSPNRPVPWTELFLTWLFTDTLPNPVGSPPLFGYAGIYRENRSSADSAKWDAGIMVQGTTNDDIEADTAWTVELRINLDSLGYTTADIDGDVVGFNFSIWDVDWFTGLGGVSTGFHRTHWESPWGNNNLFNTGRVYIRPDVTTISGALPDVMPDVVYPNLANFADPVIDGVLDEQAWENAYTFEIGWGDEDIRNSYPGLGKILSGQFQPPLSGVTAPVIDPSHSEVKIFYKVTNLYLSAFVDDAVVKKPGISGLDFIDGINFIINDKDSLNAMNFPVEVSFIAYFDTSGNGSARDWLKIFVDSGWAEYAVSLRGATTVGDSSDIDEGYIVEIKIDLTALGYSSTLDDGLFFMGVDLYDADNFDNPADNYGTRTWWFKENNDNGPLPWGVLDPTPVGVGDEGLANIPNDLRLYGNYPNPFNPATKIKYSIPTDGDVTLSIYNILGETVLSRYITNQLKGSQEFNFDASSLSSGVYLYRIKLNNHAAGRVYESKVGKMVLMK